MMDIHIGRLIAEKAKEKRLTIEEIKLALEMPRSPTYTYKKKSVPVEMLWRISENMSYNFFADLHPVAPHPCEMLRWEEIERCFNSERTKRVTIEIEFPVTLGKDLGRFIMLASELGLKMGFKVG